MVEQYVPFALFFSTSALDALLQGTWQYLSLDLGLATPGHVQGRRDDLESILHILFYHVCFPCCLHVSPTTDHLASRLIT